MNSKEFWENYWKDEMERLRKLKYVDAKKLSLDEWMALLNPDDKEKLLFIHWSFPSDEMRDEYLETIHNRTDKEVIELLRNFLMTYGRLGTDARAMENLMRVLEQEKDRFYELMEIEHVRRLFRGFITNEDVWEGNTWVIDLLPHYPKLALDVLHAYLLAHFEFLPDGKIDGMLDVMALIRAKFIETPSSLLLSLGPFQFEHLICALYKKMRYNATLTPRTYDKGRDVIAVKTRAGEKERLLIQCKRTERNVGVKEVRALLGVVSNEKANKGVLVSTSEFTPEAKKLENENMRLELIGNKDLQLLLNEYFGSEWSIYIDSIISGNVAKRESYIRRARPVR